MLKSGNPDMIQKKLVNQSESETRNYFYYIFYENFILNLN